MGSQEDAHFVRLATHQRSLTAIGGQRRIGPVRQQQPHHFDVIVLHGLVQWSVWQCVWLIFKLSKCRNGPLPLLQKKNSIFFFKLKKNQIVLCSSTTLGRVHSNANSSDSTASALLFSDRPITTRRSSCELIPSAWNREQIIWIRYGR